MTAGAASSSTKMLAHSQSAPVLSASSSSRTTFAPGTKGPSSSSSQPPPPGPAGSNTHHLTKDPPPSFTFTSAPEGYNQAPTFPQMDRCSTSSNGLFLGNTLSLTAAGPGSYKGIEQLFPLLGKSPSKTRIQTLNRRHRDLRPLVGAPAALSLNGADRLLYEDGPDMNKYDLSHLNSFRAATANKGFGTSVFKSEQGRFPPPRAFGEGVVLGVGEHEARKYHFKVPPKLGGENSSPRREDKLEKERKVRREERTRLLNTAALRTKEKAELAASRLLEQEEKALGKELRTTASREGGGRAVTPAFDGTIDWAQVESLDLEGRQRAKGMPPPAQFKMFDSWKTGMPDIAFLDDDAGGGLAVRPWTDSNAGQHLARSAVKSSQRGGGGQVTVKFDDFPNEERREETTVVFGPRGPPRFASLRKGGIEAYLEGQKEVKAGSVEVKSLDDFKAPNTKGMRFY